MSALAIEQDIALERDVAETEERSAAEPRFPGEAPGTKAERLARRFTIWGVEHPHSAYHRGLLAVSLIGSRLGLGRIDNDMVVTTTGRKSGLPRRAVLGAVLIGDHLYAMNPFGERAHWYRNLEADPIVTVQRRGRTWTARATRLTDRSEAVTLYEDIAGDSGMGLRWLQRALGITQTADGFADDLDRFCFVRFDAVDEPGPPPMPTDLVWVWPVAGSLGLIARLTRRSVIAVVGATLVAIVGLLAAVRGWTAAYSRIEAHGTHPEGWWARIFAAIGPRLTWWIYDAFDEALDLQPDDDVLDVACGCGAFLRQHAVGAHRVAGIDHSATLIDLACRDNRDRVDAGTAEFVVGDVTELPWDDGTFSVVTSNDVGCYEGKAGPAISEMYRVLRSGGRAVVADDRHALLEAAGFVEVEVEPLLRFGHITRGVKPEEKNDA